MSRKLKACTEPAKIPSNIIGNGTTSGTSEVSTVIVNSIKRFRIIET
jgi:hypothetical protein